MEIVVKILGGETVYPHPDLIPSNNWSDNTSLWPKITKENIKEYLVNAPADDGLPNNAFMSLEALDLFISGWVDIIKIHELDLNTVYLKGEVTRSQSLNMKAHQAWVCCAKVGTVLAASCTCVAGLGNVCSHISALLFKILAANVKGLTGQSCTDKPMTWNQSFKRNIIPQKVKNMRKRKHYACDNYQTTPPKLFKQYFSKEELKNSMKASPLFTLACQANTVWNSVMSSEKSNDPLINESNIPLHSDHNIDFKNNISTEAIKCEECSQFYSKFIELSQIKIALLSKETTTQSLSEVSKDARRVRLTASTASKCPKKEDTDPISFLKRHLYPTFKGCHSTQFGLDNEDVAIKDFANIIGLPVSREGTIVCETDCWLSASPDGLVGENSIIEVKCPIRNIDELIASNKYDVKVDNNGELYLSRTGKNGYYLQCQLTMHCTKRKSCYFMLWRPINPFIILITYDADFVNCELSRLRKFYFSQMLPFLCNEKNKQSHLMLGKKYLKFIGLNE